ncbi:5'-methylthioadenosine/S-adenosylhomocysteine nucleosidase [bacterium (candidate division B38) B3_B38]|nr:MAG: 5'-methylthioadenosine/S-adenosylhomocysteine nucleosidase [bacterium (candidate division B38) B3_B38]
MSSIAVIVALSSELMLLWQKTNSAPKREIEGVRFFLGEAGGQEVILIQSGVGSKRAERATSLLLENYSTDLIISAGYAGALQPHLRAAELVIPQEIYERYLEKKKEGEPAGALKLAIKVDDNLIRFARQLAEEARLRFHSGNLITSAKVISQPASKRLLGQEYSLVAVDMETAAVGRVAERNGIPFLSIRSVLDPIDLKIDLPWEQFIDKRGEVKFGFKSVFLLKKPWMAWRFMMIKRNMRQASNTLGMFIYHLILNWGRFAQSSGYEGTTNAKRLSSEQKG